MKYKKNAKTKTIRKPSLRIYLAIGAGMGIEVIGFFVVILGFSGILHYTKDMVYDKGFAIEKSIVTNVIENITLYANEGITEEEYQSMTNQTLFQLVSDGVPAVISLDDKPFIDTSRMYAFTCYTNDNTRIDIVNKWKPEEEEVLCEVWDKLQNNDSLLSVYKVALKDAYINPESKDSYLGTVIVYKEIPITGKTTTVSEYNLMPDNKNLDGYEHIEAWNQNNTAIVMFGITGSMNGNTIMDEISKEIPTSLTDTSKPSISFMAHYDTTQSHILLRSFNESVMIIIMVIATIISLIIAVIKYFRDKSIYEIIEYRRKTTDAMAHDLKSPLAVIALSAANLKESLETNPERVIFHANRIEENVVYTNKLIENILEFSNSAADTGTIDYEELSIRRTIEEYISSISAVTNSRSIKIVVEGSYDNTILTDKKLWKQAIGNLIDNAVKYTIDGATISIEIDRNSITISNPVEHNISDPERLLEPFVKGDKERGGNAGSGLGMAIANNNLAKLSNKLTVKCEDKIFAVKITYD